MRKINLGPTFKGGISTLGLILFIVFVIAFIANLISDELIGAFICLLISVVGFLLFLSIRGVEINFENKKIRSYLNLIIFKEGEW